MTNNNPTKTTVVVCCILFFTYKKSKAKTNSTKNPDLNKSAAYKLLRSCFNASKKLNPNDLSGCCPNICNNCPSIEPVKSNASLDIKRRISNPNTVALAFHKLDHCFSLSVVKNDCNPITASIGIHNSNTT